MNLARLLRYCSLTMALSSGHAAAADDAPVYSFGVVPQFEARRLAEVWVPLLTALEAHSGLRLRMEGAARIPEFEQGFVNGSFDFAYMNPYHSLLAFSAQGYVPLVREGDTYLYGILVVRADSNIEDVAELDHKRIAFPAPNALGASLLMRADLSRTFGIEFEPVYAQTHTSSYLNLLLGKVSAAGGVMSTLKQQPSGYREQLRVIYETRKIPPHPVVAHPRVPEEIRGRLTDAFLEIARSGEGRTLLARVPMPRPVRTSREDYEELAGWGLEDFFVTPGN